MKNRCNEIVLNRGGSDTDFLAKQAEKSQEIHDEGIFFKRITYQERQEVEDWLNQQNPKTIQEKRFILVLSEAIKVVKYEYFIATIEPTLSNNKIKYAIGESVAVGFSFSEWEMLAKEYSPERGSRLANLYELYIWYAWRIAKGYWTFEYVANNSASAGNYNNSPNSSKTIEKTGIRSVGGFKDGQGNTYKIVTYKESFAMCGGDYNSIGMFCPIADVIYSKEFNISPGSSSAVLVLMK